MVSIKFLFFEYIILYEYLHNVKDSIFLNKKKETVTSRPASLFCYRIPNETTISDSSSSPRDKTT